MSFGVAIHTCAITVIVPRVRRPFSTAQVVMSTNHEKYLFILDIETEGEATSGSHGHREYRSRLSHLTHWRSLFTLLRLEPVRAAPYHLYRARDTVIV